MSGRAPLAEADRAVHRAAEVVHGVAGVRLVAAAAVAAGSGGWQKASSLAVQTRPIMLAWLADFCI